MNETANTTAEETGGFTPNARQTEILKIIRESGFAETEGVARRFAKTTQTIRRDFVDLEKHGFVNRVHGGAKASPSYQNLSYAERLASNVMEKQAIGKAAAEIIDDNKSVFLSLGTSTEAVAAHLLNHKNMQFVTNNLNIAQRLRENPHSEIQLCGGVVRREDGGMLDPRAIELISNMRTDFSVIGIGAIDDEGGLFCYNIDEVHAAQAIIRNSNVTILVADEQKFGWKANHRMGNINDVDIFVTDKADNPKVIQLCREKGVKLLSAG